MNSFVTPRSSADAIADGSLVCGGSPVTNTPWP